jgi:hypothetical protein
MTQALLFRVRRSKVDAAERELTLAKEEIEEVIEESGTQSGKAALLEIAEDVEYILRECLNDLDNDGRLLKHVLSSAGRKGGKAKLDRINRFFQHLFDAELRLHETIKAIALDLAKHGCPVDGIEQLDRASRDYRKWKEDLPERLAMAFGPVKKLLQERISEAVDNPFRGSDLDKYFAGAEDATD